MALPVSTTSTISDPIGANPYSTLTAWETDLGSAQLDADYTAEIEGEITDAPTFFGIDGSLGSPDPYQVIITAKSGFEADGTNEATCAKNVGRIRLLGSLAVRFVVQNIEISDDTSGIVVGNSAADTEYTITKNVIRDISTSFGIDIGGLSTENQPVRIGCNLLIDCGVAAFDAAIRMNNFGTTTGLKILNNTIYHSAPVTNTGGLYEAGGEIEDARNNAVCLYDNRDANTPVDYLSSPSNVDYCAGSGDGTVTGANSIDTLRDDGTDWTDTSISDFSLVSDGVLVGTGVTISGESWFPATDLVGTTWADPPAIGCFEVVGGPIQLPNKLIIPLTDNTVSFVGKKINSGSVVTRAGSASLTNSGKEGLNALLAALAGPQALKVLGQKGAAGAAIISQILDDQEVSAAGKSGLNGAIDQTLSDLVLAALGQKGTTGAIATSLDLIVSLLGFESQVIFSGVIDSSLGDNVPSTIGNTGATGSVSAQLGNLVALLTGAAGHTGDMSVNILTGVELLAKIGVTGAMDIQLLDNEVRMIEITVSDKIYQILISTKTGQIKILAPKTGSIDISTQQ